MDLVQAKTELRARLKAELRRLAPELKKVNSQAITSRILELPEFVDAHVVMIFLSMPGEVDTSQLADSAWHMKKRVVVPKLILDEQRLAAVEIESLESGLVHNPLGFVEPSATDGIPLEDVAFMVVPGLGFDRTGRRLGRGGGYYDRLLAQPEFGGVACAVGFEIQLLDDVPVGPLDRVVDMIVTEAQVYRCDGRAQSRGPT